MDPYLLTQKKGIRSFAFRPGRRGFVSTLGYNTASTVYTQDQSIGKFSGSSLNRKISKIKKDEYQKDLKEQKEKAQAAGWTIATAISEHERVKDLRRDQAIKRRNSERLSDTFDRSELSLPLFCRFFDEHFKKGLDRGAENGLVGRIGEDGKRGREVCPRLQAFSKRTRGKVRDKATAFFRALGEEKTFLTLTFIQHLTDKEAISILNKFFTMVRKKTGGSPLLYLWVAERQMIGRIHFHIIINKYLPVKEYNALWVRQQYHAGLRHKAIDPDEIDRLDDFEISSKLNPLDIVEIKDGKRGDYQLSWYLTKYITENESIGFTCQAWNCSIPVSRLFTKQVATRETMSKAYGLENSRTDLKTGEVIQGKMIEGKFFRLVYIQNRPLFYRQLRELEEINRWILTGACPRRLPEIDYLEDFVNRKWIQKELDLNFN